jgi:hypothetical protein
MRCVPIVSEALLAGKVWCLAETCFTIISRFFCAGMDAAHDVGKLRLRGQLAARVRLLKLCLFLLCGKTRQLWARSELYWERYLREKFVHGWKTSALVGYVFGINMAYFVRLFCVVPITTRKHGNGPLVFYCRVSAGFVQLEYVWF